MLASWSRTKRYRAVVALFLGAVIVWFAIVVALHLVVPRLQDWIRNRAIAALQDEFGRPVRIQSSQASASGARLRIVAKGIEIGDIVRVQRADVQSALFPWRIHSMVLEGLSVHLSATSDPASLGKGGATVIDEIVAHDASVDILKLHFRFAQLRLRDFDPRRATEFSGSVLVAEPQALIEEHGTIGPWNLADPSQTPVDAAYTIQDCNLATEPGLAGTLASQGHVHGILRRAAIAGDAEIAAFGLNVGGRTQPLHAHFEATIDASDGSAAIDALAGTLRDSSFAGHGTVRNIEDDRRREIGFDVRVPKGRLEDVLPLGVRSKISPISGALQAQGKVDVVSGQKNILDRMRVTASFNAANARFASFDLRERLRDMSRKAQGRPKDQTAGSSISSMQGRVEIAGGIARFSQLEFDLEGASAQLQGTYQLASEQMDLTGMVTMDAKLSQTTTGAKAVLLKMAEPFLKSKHGGAQVAIRVTGTREDPQFGLSLVKKGPQTR